MSRFGMLALAIASGLALSGASARELVFNDKFEELPPVPSVLRPGVVEAPPAVAPVSPAPAPAYSMPISGQHRPIDYVYKHPRHGKFTKCDTTPVTLLINDPCTHCLVEVPICVPACCLSCPPQISCIRGAFGRDIVTYCWSCGFDVKIAFRNKTDGLIVIYSDLQRR